MNTFKLITAIALLLCLAPMPYGYYILVRYIATILFGIMAYQYYREKKEALMIVFGALAILFQPIVKIPLGRGMWNVVDVAMAVILIISLLKNKKTPEEPKIQEPENKFDKYSDAKANNPRLADIGSNFITSISRLPSIKELANLNILLEYLPGLSLDEHYVLDDYNPSRPRSIGKNLSLYARLKTVEKPRDIDFPEIYDRIHREIEIRSNSKAKADEMLGERKPLPEREDPFKHITLPFTEEAIWRAYLLKQTDHLIGMYWHGLYNKRIFINKAEDIDSISPIHCDYELKNLDIIKAEAKKCWSDNMCPLVVLDGDKAYVSHYWFDHWHGLKQVQCLVSYDHTSHTITDFQIKECEPIIRYHGGVYY